jgi:hypothetical protein
MAQESGSPRTSTAGLWPREAPPGRTPGQHAQQMVTQLIYHASERYPQPRERLELAGHIHSVEHRHLWLSDDLSQASGSMGRGT